MFNQYALYRPLAREFAYLLQSFFGRCCDVLWRKKIKHFLSLFLFSEPSSIEVCSVESFRAALGISCTGAIAVINAIGKMKFQYKIHSAWEIVSYFSQLLWTRIYGTVVRWCIVFNFWGTLSRFSFFFSLCLVVELKSPSNQRAWENIYWTFTICVYYRSLEWYFLSQTVVNVMTNIFSLGSALCQI